MNITVVQHGRLRDPAIAELTAEYRKRFGRFGKLTVVEKDPKGEALLWPETCRWRVALDEHGEQLDSAAFAKRLAQWTATHGALAFLIGAADGLHGPSRATASTTMRLSDLTLPHQFAHLLLIEQLYRAATILAGHPYHRA